MFNRLAFLVRLTTSLGLQMAMAERFAGRPTATCRFVDYEMSTPVVIRLQHLAPTLSW